MRGRGLQGGNGVVQPRHGAGIGSLRVNAFVGPDRRDDDDLVPHAVEDGGDGGSQQDRVGQAQGIRRRVGQVLHLPRHVIAQIAEQSRRHRRQALRYFQPGLVGQRAQALQRLGGLGHEHIAAEGIAIDFSHAVPAAPDQVRLQPDDGIAAAGLAALDAFQQEGIVLAIAELQEGRNRRLHVGDQPRINKLRAARLIPGSEICEGSHQLPPPTTA